MTRAREISAFLKQAGWPKAQRIPLAGDAGIRRYERLSDLKQGNAILMDAEPKLGEDIRSFLKISQHLLDCGISAPKIFNQYISLGLILMEDFGDELLYKAVNDTPHLELQLYRLAIDVLNQLHKSPPPKQVGSYFPPEMSKALVTTLPWYCDKGLSQEIIEEAAISLSKLDWSNPVLVLRDFHAQNLIYRYEQRGLAQMGVLDFQDAQLGHPLYDVTSLIHDARRILNPSVVSLLLQELTKNYRGQDDFKYAFSTLSAQRNLRILGVFARLCLQDKKPNYLNLIPHVWNNLWKDLSHPLLTNLSKICESLPNPSSSFLEGLWKNG